MSRKRHTPSDEPHFLVRTADATFADGGRLEAHAHPWGQLIYATSGVLTVWTAQGSWVAPPQWAVWAPAEVAHALRFTGVTRLRTLYVREGLAPALKRSVVIDVSPLLRELIERAVDLGMLDERDATHVAMTHLILDEMREHTTASLDLPQPRTEILRRVAAEVAAAPDRREGLAALARRFAMSTRTLERGFARETGLSFGRWRRQARFLHALRRLGSGASVKEAAIDSGYRSSSAFIAAFRSTLNMTPARYFTNASAITRREISS